jgi:ComF family protein
LLEPAGPDAGHAYVYGGPLADALRRLKYEGRTELAPAVATLLQHGVRPHAGRVDVVVPVPLHRRRLLERGFNQAALLAGPLARSLGVAMDVRRLRRRRPTPPQVGLEPDARRHNVRGAFVGRADPKRPRVLLIDDVRTTGATLRAAADALRAAGATEVCTLAVAGVG